MPLGAFYKIVEMQILILERDWTTTGCVRDTKSAIWSPLHSISILYGFRSLFLKKNKYNSLTWEKYLGKIYISIQTLLFDFRIPKRHVFLVIKMLEALSILCPFNHWKNPLPTFTSTVVCIILVFHHHHHHQVTRT